MMEFLKKMFGGAPNSSSTAKERLRLVLMTDHLALAPELIEAMKRDLVDVISRYVEVDREKVEVNFEREDKALAMMANIPIVAVNRPKGGDGERLLPGSGEAPSAVATASQSVRVEPEAETVAPQVVEAVATEPAAALPAVAAATVMGAPNVASPGAEAATAASAPPPMRRRRKKKGHGNGPVQNPPNPRTSPAY